jgi:hypothetical protein
VDLKAGSSKVGRLFASYPRQIDETSGRRHCPCCLRTFHRRSLAIVPMRSLAEDPPDLQKSISDLEFVTHAATPKGFHPSAQGQRRSRATLGKASIAETNPERVPQQTGVV